jgi:hypothetical protein
VGHPATQFEREHPRAIPGMHAVPRMQAAAEQVPAHTPTSLWAAALLFRARFAQGASEHDAGRARHLSHKVRRVEAAGQSEAALAPRLPRERGGLANTSWSRLPNSLVGQPVHDGVCQEKDEERTRGAERVVRLGILSATPCHQQEEPDPRRPLGSQSRLFLNSVTSLHDLTS